MWSEEDIVTGERIQAICDITITCAEIDRFHMSVSPTVRKLFLEDPDFAMLDSARTVFCYTHLLEHFFRLVFPWLRRPVVFVTHNSDDVVDGRWISYLEDPRISHWFAQSCLMTHPKLTPIPIGIANAQWGHGDVALLCRIANAPSEGLPRSGSVYANFDVRSNPTHRLDVAHQLVRAGHQFRPPCQDQTRYLTEMKTFCYVACPKGNSPDTHRFWEASYLGTMPVVENTEMYRRMGVTHAFAKPGRWGSGNFEVFRGSRDVDAKSMKYWAERIRSASAAASDDAQDQDHDEKATKENEDAA